MTERKWTPCAAQSAEYHAGYNQALIDTAAPELYEALEEACDPINGYLYGPALDRARAALSKARGE